MASVRKPSLYKLRFHWCFFNLNLLVLNAFNSKWKMRVLEREIKSHALSYWKSYIGTVPSGCYKIYLNHKLYINKFVE